MDYKNKYNGLKQMYLKYKTIYSTTFTIVGLTIEKYIGEMVEGHANVFTYTDQEMERYVLQIQKNDLKYLLTLETAYGECMSGWTSASWGIKSITEVDYFENPDYIPGSVAIISDDIEKHIKKFECEYFTYDNYGDDEYYPSGGVSVNTYKFENREMILTDLLQELPFIDDQIISKIIEY